MAPTDRFAVLAPSWSRDGTGKSVAERMRQPAEGERGQKRSVAELMKQSGGSSPPSQDKGRNGGRARDEVFSEINTLLSTNSTLQLADFDYRIRQHLHALLGSGGREKLHNALETINKATSKRSRHDVKNWPAYLRKLLTKFEEDIAFDKALDKDRQARAQAHVEKAPGVENETGSKKTTPRELSDEEEQEAWMEALDKNLSKEDQWLNEIHTVDARQRTPSPPKEAPPPPPKELALRIQQQSCPSPVQPACQPPHKAPAQAPPFEGRSAHAPSQRPPTTPPRRPSAVPATPPPPMPPPMPQTTPSKVLSKPPTEPPRGSPESYLRASCPQSPLKTQTHSAQQCHANGKHASSATLDFPLEAWASWLHCPPQHVAAN